MTLFGCAMVFSVNTTYQSYIHEPIFQKYNFLSISFILASGFAFYLSARLAYHIDQSYKPPIFTSRYSTNRIEYLMLGSNLLYSAFLIFTIGISNIAGLLLAGGSSGNEFKIQVSEAISDSRLGWINDFSLALIVWCLILRLNQQKKGILYLATSIILFSFNSLVSVSRDSLISLLLMSLMIYLMKIYNLKKLTYARLARLAIYSAGGFVIVFAGIGLVRSSHYNSPQEEVIRQFMGYFPASYNRLNAVISSNLHYPDSGWGYYATQGIWDVPLISGALGIYDAGRSIGISLPKSSNENWRNQFIAVNRSGLNQSYIWATIYGFLYSDFGYYSIIYFLVYGYISGFVFSGFVRGDSLRMLLYPFIFTTIIKWPSIVSFSQRNMIIFIVTAVFIIIFNRASLRNRGENTYDYI